MWHADATHNTLITTGNGGSEPTTAEVTLFYNGGTGRYKMVKLLSPGEPCGWMWGNSFGIKFPIPKGRLCHLM